MAIECRFIDVVIPISKIDKVYPGGFEKFKKDNGEGFSNRLYHDQFLFRDGAMSPKDVKAIADEWELRGLKGVVNKNGVDQWEDFCVVTGIMGGPTLPCSWLEFDPVDNCVFLKGFPRGKIFGPNNK